MRLLRPEDLQDYQPNLEDKIDDWIALTLMPCIVQTNNLYNLRSVCFARPDWMDSANFEDVGGMLSYRLQPLGYSVKTSADPIESIRVIWG